MLCLQYVIHDALSHWNYYWLDPEFFSSAILKEIFVLQPLRNLFYKSSSFHPTTAANGERLFRLHGADMMMKRRPKVTMVLTPMAKVLTDRLLQLRPVATASCENALFTMFHICQQPQPTIR
jgi:hypothetical protein